MHSLHNELRNFSALNTILSLFLFQRNLGADIGNKYLPRPNQPLLPNDALIPWSVIVSSPARILRINVILMFSSLHGKRTGSISGTFLQSSLLGTLPSPTPESYLRLSQGGEARAFLYPIHFALKMAGLRYNTAE